MWKTHSGDPEFDSDALLLDTRGCPCSLRREQPPGRRKGRENDLLSEAGDDALYQVATLKPVILKMSLSGYSDSSRNPECIHRCPRVRQNSRQR